MMFFIEIWPRGVDLERVLGDLTLTLLQLIHDVGLQLEVRIGPRRPWSKADRTAREFERRITRKISGRGGGSQEDG